MASLITSVGNAGFRVTTPSACVFVDAFYYALPGVAMPAAVLPDEVTHADLILVTHAHPDHFLPGPVADVAHRTGATVVGPQSVTQQLAGQVAARQLATLEPAPAGKSWANSLSADFPGARVTAFRTFHSPDHNSYLVKSAGLRFFHDGDNGLTHRYRPDAIGSLDALLIGPWQGSGWVEFIEKLAPQRYFLMHLTSGELEETLAGRFLPEICDRVPDGLVVLRPGESHPL